VGNARVAVMFEHDSMSRRFIRAAISGCGYDEVVEAADVDAFVREVADRQPDLLVIDPAVEEGAGMHALTLAHHAAPGALAVALSGDAGLLQEAEDGGITAVHRVSVVKLDAFREAIAPGSALGLDAEGFVPSDEELSTLRVKLNEEFAAPEPDLDLES
jgi:DNA-binding NarL/FixJ family response regulator